MRLFEAIIQDLDGEEHDYHFMVDGPNALWSVLRHIDQTMRDDGDFYGHKADATMNLEVHELVASRETLDTAGNFIWLAKEVGV